VSGRNGAVTGMEVLDMNLTRTICLLHLIVIVPHKESPLSSLLSIVICCEGR